jgi:hypothetical protein
MHFSRYSFTAEAFDHVVDIDMCLVVTQLRAGIGKVLGSSPRLAFLSTTGHRCSMVM